MDHLDQLISQVGEDATYSWSAAERLERRLTLEPSPLHSARRRNLAAAIAFAGVAGCAGGVTGALIEFQQAPNAAILLPASQAGTVASMFNGQG